MGVLLTVSILPRMPLFSRAEARKPQAPQVPLLCNEVLHVPFWLELGSRVCGKVKFHSDQELGLASAEPKRKLCVRMAEFSSLRLFSSA